MIYFCCSISGRKSDAISLPYRSPFYLIAYGSPRCQQVRYHKASVDFVLLQLNLLALENTGTIAGMPFGRTGNFAP